MNTIAFDFSGSCIFVVNDYLTLDEAPNATAIAYSENSVDPNSVWYDFVSGEMRFKSPIPFVVQTNKITGLRSGTIAYLRNERILVEDDVIDFEVSYPETLVVVLMHPQFLSATVEVPCEVQG